MPDRVRITDVAPRDGLQNEQAPIPTERLPLVRSLAGETVVVRNFIVMFRPPFKEGDMVEIAYDPQKPKTAFLPILYATPLSKWVRRIGIALLSIVGLGAILLVIALALM